MSTKKWRGLTGNWGKRRVKRGPGFSLKKPLAWFEEVRRAGSFKRALAKLLRNKAERARPGDPCS